jgi:RimJ/RimL family protein N-acetyltransferase
MQLNWKFKPTTIDEIEPQMLKHKDAFSSLIEGFLIDYIYDSKHYLILVNDCKAGYFSIHNKSLITQFHLDRQYSAISQSVFYDVRKMVDVQIALVPTCDEYFLSHALDDFSSVEKQAYTFEYDSNEGKFQIDPKFTGRIAEPNEIDFIEDKSGDFFGEEDLPVHLKKGEIWITYYDDVCIGFGLIIKIRLFPDVASIGMYTVDNVRRKGHAKRTIQFLINECLSRNLRVTAGCWYYNHSSKKTLERAGMYCNSRLLKVKY